MTVRVLIVDDSEPFRAAAAAVVDATPGFEVVGEAASGEESLSAVTALAPDLVLLDVVMPGLGGPETARRIRARDGGVSVVLLSTYEGEDYRAPSEECGAIAFVPKAEFGPEVLAALAG